ncbi:MAG: polyribonucleotide nucleotidyltransferase [Campylobacterales bacterium]|nr:polyribonucleotide nucleotidyltransferase [Campylobacterales bacterium]
MSETTISIINNQITESFTFGKVAKQANGSVWYKQGNAVLIATVAVDKEPVKEDFLPLTVQYIEKSYAAAKIPGGFIKRESKPSDFETLTSRIVDRSLRPLFPKGFNYPITITVLVVSSDSSVDMQLAAIHAANSALLTSNIPVSKSVAAVRVGIIDDEVVHNPSLDIQERSQLDLLVVGSADEVIMIEMRTIQTESKSNVLPEDQLITIVANAGMEINNASNRYYQEFIKLKNSVLELELFSKDADMELEEYISSNFADDVYDAICHMAKSERSNALDSLKDKIISKLLSENIEVEEGSLYHALSSYKAKVSRAMILNEKKRADGRKLDEVRPITIETNLLPSVHGSCLFTRGQTQALVTVTLGDKKDAQMYELITDKTSRSESFMVHYNFPGFSVGDSKPIGPTNRRELGHGNLAKRALECTVSLEPNQSVRVVSEILESNGSSSMATVCGGSLALCAAGVNVESLVAGIAMGLMSDGEKYAVLTDIMGLEDFEGDMDFKVAGTISGVSAMQMDIKLHGISIDIIKDTLMEAKKGKEHILSIMLSAQESMKPSLALPKTEYFSVPVTKIVDIIGKAGTTIREIIEKFEVSIDLDRDKGGVKLSGQDEQKLQEAKAYIQNIADAPVREQMVYELGKIYQGKVKKIMDFGVFVEMPDGYDALLHISKVDKSRVNNLSERYSVDDIIDVIVLEQSGKKIELATPVFVA